MTTNHKAQKIDPQTVAVNAPITTMSTLNAELLRISYTGVACDVWFAGADFAGVVPLLDGFVAFVDVVFVLVLFYTTVVVFFYYKTRGL